MRSEEKRIVEYFENSSDEVAAAMFNVIKTILERKSGDSDVAAVPKKKQKRHRRTKAEIQAAKEAEEAA